MIERPDYQGQPPGLSGGRRQDKTRRKTPKPSPKTQKRILGHDRTARLARPAPALSGGGREDKTHRNTPKPGPKTQKRVLGHDRTARLPRPALALTGGGRQDKTHRNTPKPDPKTQKTPEPINKKKPRSRKQEKRETIGRGGGAKISCPRLRLETHLRHVGPPVQTR